MLCHQAGRRSSTSLADSHSHLLCSQGSSGGSASGQEQREGHVYTFRDMQGGTQTGKVTGAHTHLHTPKGILLGRQRHSSYNNIDMLTQM